MDPSQTSLSEADLDGSILFDQVKILASDNQDILLDIEKLELPSSGLIIVSGHSGAGKSIFAETLCGLRQLSSGSIKVGAYELEPASLNAWQKRIAFLPQEAFLFHGSVRDNLNWPGQHHTDEALWDALAQAGLKSIVEELPDKLDESLRAAGARLSGGERQRLCLARTLLRPAQIFVLDEPTANLDVTTERHIVETLKAIADRALIIWISHNPDIQFQADMTIEFQHGQIATDARHENRD